MKKLKSNVNDIATFSKLGFLINKIFSIFILSICTVKFIYLKFCNYEIHLELQLLTNCFATILFFYIFRLCSVLFKIQKTIKALTYLVG